jgi:DNA-binding NarL/FixJ family response regulator
LEQDLSLKKQLLDVVILRREEGPFSGRLPDGLEDLARHNLPQREALVRHYWQGQSLPEIARALDRTPAAVAGLLHRGLKKLRALLVEPA